jgi:hypothetical protein
MAVPEMARRLPVAMALAAASYRGTLDDSTELLAEFG